MSYPQSFKFTNAKEDGSIIQHKKVKLFLILLDFH